MLFYPDRAERKAYIKAKYEERQFRGEVHVRHHTSDAAVTSVRTYIWPALIRGNTVLSKAVVVT